MTWFETRWIRYRLSYSCMKCIMQGNSQRSWQNTYQNPLHTPRRHTTATAVSWTGIFSHICHVKCWHQHCAYVVMTWVSVHEAIMNGLKAESLLLGAIAQPHCNLKSYHPPLEIHWVPYLSSLTSSFLSHCSMKFLCTFFTCAKKLRPKLWSNEKNVMIVTHQKM